MTISDSIRSLANEGLPTAEIARRLGIRYQHAYNVLKGHNGKLASRSDEPRQTIAGSETIKPPLFVADLLTSGFSLVGKWLASPEHALIVDRALPKDVGVYVFAKSDRALYVGVATMGVAKRLRFYGKPGATQRTSIRINAQLLDELRAEPCIDIYAAFPPDQQWNGLPVHGAAGLELGLIKRYALPWNMRGT